jgi:ubiquitin-protein ligase
VRCTTSQFIAVRRRAIENWQYVYGAALTNSFVESPLLFFDFGRYTYISLFEMTFYSRLCAVITVLVVIVDIIASKKAPGNALGKTRILSEIRDIYRNKISTDQPFNLTNDEIGIRLSPMKGNLLEFHFSFTGVEGSSYSGGIYHGRILLHPDYPRKAPAISVLTPTGRWECGKDICLSGSVQSDHLFAFIINYSCQTKNNSPSILT